METESANNAPSFYVAVIINEISVETPDFRPDYEECFVLIKVSSRQEANEKALNYARQQQCSYKNE